MRWDSPFGVDGVLYPLPDDRPIDEVKVVRARSGIGANYSDPYMRRRDPDCMVIADEMPSDKPRFDEVFGLPLNEIRQATFDWLVTQDLATYAFEMGQPMMGGNALAIYPASAGFFAFGWLFYRESWMSAR